MVRICQALVLAAALTCATTAAYCVELGDGSVRTVEPTVGAPGPLLGAGLPGLLAIGGGVLLWVRARRRNAN